MILEIVEHVVDRVDGLGDVAVAEKRSLLARRLRFRVFVAQIETVPLGGACDLGGGVSLAHEDAVVAGIVVVTHQDDPETALVFGDRAVGLIGELDFGAGGSPCRTAQHTVDLYPLFADFDRGVPGTLRFERQVLGRGLVLAVGEYHLERRIVIVPAVDALGVDDAADLENRHGIHRGFVESFQLDRQSYLCGAAV